MGSKAFKNLQAKWYRKLEESGFEDIEDEDEQIKVSATQFANPRNYSGNTKTWAKEHFEKKKYYERASRLLKEDSFLDETERRIWELHSRGVPIRKIVLILRAEGIDKGKNQVNQIINELQGLMFEAGS